MMRSFDRSTLAVTLSVLLATLTVTPLTQDRSFLSASWLLLALLCALSLVLRRSRLATSAVLAVQLLVGLGYTLTLSFLLPGAGETWLAHLVAHWAGGISHMRSQASPMDPNSGVTLIFTTVIGLVWIVTDTLATATRHPVWTIAPTGAMFLVPALGLSTDTGPLAFGCIAVGYLAVLVADGLNSTARWTKGLSYDSAQGRGTEAPVVWRAATLIGVPALVLTLAFGMLLPTFSLNGVGLGGGSGGSGALQLTDPTLDLKRNLTEPQDKKVIEYRTSGNGGEYLRLASLPQFSSAGWTNIPMQLDPGEELPQAPGLSEEPKGRRTSTIKVLDFKSEYLPLPFAPSSIRASGSWAYDPNSLVVLSMSRGDRANAIRNLTYTVTSVDVAPKGDDLVDALAGTPADSDVTSVVPPDLPAALTRLTREVTAGQTTAAGKAAAIQQYLRSDLFTYSTEQLPGTGYQALENFLLKDRKGYCEQFAASMAMMARVVGIPSRVAVGFLPGKEDGDHWNVTIRDMHAWPELYFSGYGWVRYEPTPAITGRPPAWTVPNAGTPSKEPSETPSAAPSASAPRRPDEPSSGPSQQSSGSAVEQSFPWAKTLWSSGLGLVGLLILSAPATIRFRRRSARLTGDGPTQDRVEAVWQEIRDTVVDYGGTWPDGSPRVIGGRIGERLPAAESDTMTRVATLVERSRYAPSFSDEEATRSLPGMAADIRRGIALPQSRWRRAAAVLLPRSLFHRRR